MAEDFGCWWKFRNLEGDHPTLIISKEDFSAQEANVLAPRLSYIQHHWRSPSGYVKVEVNGREFYAIFHADSFLSSLTLPHPYPNGRRSPRGLRTLDTSKIVGFEGLGQFDAYGDFIEERIDERKVA
jgi:hypothetical protein